MPRKRKFREPMPMKTHTLGAGQFIEFIEFIVPVKGMKHMNIV